MNDNHHLPPPTGDLKSRRVSLLKGDDHWSFTWFEGDEDNLIEALLSMAADEQIELDWFDVAVIRQQMVEALAATSPDCP